MQTVTSRFSAKVLGLIYAYNYIASNDDIFIQNTCRAWFSFVSHLTPEIERPLKWEYVYFSHFKCSGDLCRHLHQ